MARIRNRRAARTSNSGASWTQTRETIRAAVQAELDSANKKLAEKN